MKALIIYNNFSGKSKINNKLDYIVKRLNEKYEVIDCYESKEKKDIRECVLLYANRYNTIIIIGGDGSINEAINGLMMLKEKPLLGYIPMGTCNDFGNSLGLKKDLDEILDIILKEETVLINVNKLNTDYFIYGMATGSFTDVSYKTKHKYKKRFGVLAYFINAIKSFFIDNSFSCQINLDDKIIKRNCFCIIVVNSRYLASFKLRLKNNILDDDNLKVVIINKKNKFMNLIDLGLFFLFGDKYIHNIEYYNSKRIRINADKVLKYNIDGEEVPLLRNVNVEVLSKEIKIIVDRTIKEKYFNN